MSDDVFDKLDALIKKHAANEPEIPVLTDLVEAPSIDLKAIPVLTEEINTAPQALELELDLIPEPIRIDPEIQQAQTESALARINALESELHAEVNARIAQVQTEPAPPTEFHIEIPQNAEYIALPNTPIEIHAPIADTQIDIPPPPDESMQAIAAQIEANVARTLKETLHKTLSEELSGMLNLTLDKALSSMLDQHMMTLEETVRSTIADELKKQLAPFKRPPSKS